MTIWWNQDPRLEVIVDGKYFIILSDGTTLGGEPMYLWWMAQPAHGSPRWVSSIK
jgi:hypothetical protein